MHGINVSPVQHLQELFVKERGAVRFFEEGRRGPPHDPTYRFSCTVFGNVFYGHGNSKQSAKQDAARNALQFIGESRRRAHPYFPRAPCWRRPLMTEPRQPMFYNSVCPQRPPPLLPYNFGNKGPLLPTPTSTLKNSNIECMVIEPVSGDDFTAAEANEPSGSSASSMNTARPFSEFAIDSLEDSSDFIKFDQVVKQPENSVTEKPVEVKKQKAKERIMLRIMSEGSETQNPIALIHELNPDCHWQFIKAETSGQLASMFTMQLTINESLFIGTGKTKKLAKWEASKTALSELYNINLPNDSNVPQSYIRVDEPLLLNQEFANSIGNLVIWKSREIFELSAELKKWNVLASIILTNENKPDWCDIVCITSGTKCVKGDNLSMLGHVVGDCHAEILARRCFLLFLYRQINAFLDSGGEDKPDFVIESRKDSRGYKLKDGINVNLFISTAPCGDSRVFSPKEETLTDSHPNRQSRGVLRAKIECGEGTIPVKKETSTLTWDGILQGQQRLQFMSCSDKICLWNVVGLQGSLLSHIIDPIYLNSVIVGSLFNYEHLVRGIHGRLNLNFESDALKSLPQPFKVNKSRVAKSVLNDFDYQRQVSKSQSYAINWIKGDTKLEVINCETGKLQEGTASRLSKKFLFSQFCNILGRNVSTLTSSPLNSSIPVVYRDAKTSAHNYQKAKTCAIQAFIEQGLGTWIEVPTEIDLFLIDSFLLAAHQN